MRGHLDTTTKSIVRSPFFAHARSVSEFRFNFLNWRPDLEDTEHDGLSVAQNVIHEPEGYKPVGLASAGAFSTTISATSTVLSLVAKPVGSEGDLLCAWITANGNLNIGLNGVTAGSTTTGYPLAFATAPSNTGIVAFDVCEYAGKIFFVVEAANNTVTPSTTVTLRHIGYMDY